MNRLHDDYAAVGGGQEDAVGSLASHARRYAIQQSCGRAIRELRDLEDFARLELHDETLAGRAREAHELVSQRILDGRKGVGLSRAQMEQALAYFEAGLE